MSAFLSGDPALDRRTSLSTFIARPLKESALGTVTHAVSASALCELSSPAAAGYGSTAVVGGAKRLTAGTDESTWIGSDGESAWRSLASSGGANDWLPSV